MEPQLPLQVAQVQLLFKPAELPVVTVAPTLVGIQSVPGQLMLYQPHPLQVQLLLWDVLHLALTGMLLEAQLPIIWMYAQTQVSHLM